jgi:hypothetical protein
LTNSLPLSQKRRALSSIVGALLFVVLMVATFAVLGVALDSQTDIVETSRQVTDTGLKKQQERFVINSIVQLPGDSLQVNVTNTGQNPSEIFTLVVTNSSDVTNGYPTQTIEIPSDTSFLPPNSNTSVDILETLNFKMKDSPSIELYQFKIISSLGNIEKLFVVCQNGACGQGGGGGSSGLFAQFLMDGPNGINTKNSTAVMFVTNTGEVPLDDVAPNFACSKGAMFSISPDVENDDDFKSCELVPTSIDTLSAGQTAIFKWDGEVQGEIGDVFTFCNQASGTDPDLNTVTSDFVCDQLTVIDPNDCGGCGGEGGETIILIDDLLIRPSIFMVIPSPFGDTQDNQNDRGVWGINVANPTDEPLDISKVTIVAYPPGGNSQDTVFNGYASASPCLAEDIHPGDPLNPFDIAPDPTTLYAGDWTCPRDNILMWQNFTNPITVPANSTQSFMVKVEPSIIKSGDNIDALIVQANVYSTFGSFGKAAYQSSMYEEKSPIVNVYMSDSINSRTNIIGNENNIAVNSANTFNISIADMDNQPDTFVKAGAKLIINVPREWTFNNFISCDGFDDIDGDGDCNDANSPTATVHADGSTQIIGITKGVLGNGVNDVRTITFNATAPDVNSPRLYVMYVLGDGIVSTPTGGDKTIGPLNEVVLNVDP